MYNKKLMIAVVAVITIIIFSLVNLSSKNNLLNIEYKPFKAGEEEG